MTNVKKKRVVASLILAKAQGPLPEKSKVALATFQCTNDKCGERHAVNAGIKEPFCGACGHDMKPLANATAEDLYTLASEELVEFPCIGEDCGAFIKMNLATAKTLDGTIHCSSCGTKMHYPVKALFDDEELDDSEDVSEDDGLFGGDEIEEESTDDADADDLDFGEDQAKAGKKCMGSDDADADDAQGEDGEGDAGEEAGDDEQGEGEAESEDGESEEESSDDADADDADSAEGEGNAEEETASDDGDADDANGDSEGDDSEEESGDEGADEEDVDLMDTVDVEESKVHVKRVDANIILFAGNIALAGLKANEETADVFGRESFLKAVRASLANKGLRSTIAQFNFTPVRVKLKVQARIKNEVAKARDAAMAQVQAEREQFAETLRQSLAIAAAKLNRNMENVPNPLKAALFNALASLGVKGGEKLIEAAFKDAADEYHTTLLTLGFDLSSKSEEVRNEIAKIVAASDYMNPEVDDEESEEEAGGGDDDVGPDDEMFDEEEGEEESRFEVTSSVETRLKRGGKSLKPAGDNYGGVIPRGRLFK